MSVLKIGDKLYTYIEERDRRYYDNKCFKEYEICGQTPRSWLVREYSRDIKISKKDLSSDNAPYGRIQWYTEEDTIKYEWLYQNGGKVTALLEKYKYRYNIENYEFYKMLHDLFLEKGLIE